MPHPTQYRSVRRRSKCTDKCIGGAVERRVRVFFSWKVWRRMVCCRSVHYQAAKTVYRQVPFLFVHCFVIWEWFNFQSAFDVFMVYTYSFIVCVSLVESSSSITMTHSDILHLCQFHSQFASIATDFLMRSLRAKATFSLLKTASVMFRTWSERLLHTCSTTGCGESQAVVCVEYLSSALNFQNFLLLKFVSLRVFC